MRTVQNTTTRAHLVHANRALGRARGQLEAEVARRELNVGDIVARVHEVAPVRPRLVTMLRVDALLIHVHDAIGRARRQHLAKLGMRPRNFIHRARVRLDLGDELPLAALVL